MVTAAVVTSEDKKADPDCGGGELSDPRTDGLSGTSGTRMNGYMTASSVLFDKISIIL